VRVVLGGVASEVCEVWELEPGRPLLLAYLACTALRCRRLSFREPGVELREGVCWRKRGRGDGEEGE